MSNIGRWVKEALTDESDAQDIHRWIAVAAAAVGIGLSVYAVVWKGQTWDIQSYGIGIGSLLAGTGAAIWFRKDGRQDGDRNNGDGDGH